jgi:hypothetical protein
MEDRCAPADGTLNCRIIPYVGYHAGDSSRMPSAEPIQVPLNARARQGIKNKDVISFACKAVGKITADETGPSGDENGCHTC